jgi:ATP-dependent Clp protease protease subunit
MTMSDKSKKFHYEVKNQNASPEITIYGYIGQWDEVDYKGFQNAFRNILSTNKDMTVRIHSGGGSVYEGLAIYDLMRSSDSNITVIVEGMAASMASIIALGGDVVNMAENAFFMMHAPQIGCSGSKEQLDSAIKQLASAEIRLREIYKERIGVTDALIDEWFKPSQETWLDSAQCLSLKICDEVITPTKKRLSNALKNITKKTPEQIFAAYEGEVPNEIKNQINEKMKNRIISMLAVAGIVHALTASSEDEDFEKVLKGALEKAKRCETAEASLKTFQTTNAKILVDNAVEEGKIPANEKEQWLTDAIQSPELTARALSRMVGKPDLNASVNRDAKTIETGQHESLKNRADWSFDKWQTEDPKGLAKLEDEAPADFEKLFNAKFKK